jgi:hypothetical protein
VIQANYESSSCILLIFYYSTGAGLSFLAGGVFGWTFGHEIANHALQLYRVDTLASEAKFLEWWKRKTEGGY